MINFDKYELKSKKFKLKPNDFFLIFVNVSPNQNVSYGSNINHIFNVTFSATGMVLTLKPLKEDILNITLEVSTQPLDAE